MSTRAFPTYCDGYLGAARRISRTPREYPFAALGDTTTARYRAAYLVRQDQFTPAVRGSVDPEAAGFYLETESQPEIETGDIARFTRTYSSLPGDQVSYGSRVITKPNASTLGTSLGVFYDYTSSDTSPTLRGASTAYLSSMWADNKIYSSLAGTSLLTFPTGGTFTVTYKTATTAALAYNDSNATIAAAINALADVVTDGLTVSCTNELGTSNGHLVLVLTVGSTTSRFSANAASLTPAAASTAFNTFNTTTSQTIKIAHRVPLTAHGLSGGSSLVAVKSASGTLTTVLLPTSQWSVIDANTIALNPTFAGGNFYNAFGQYLRAYTPGTDRIGLRSTQKFYLPGVSGGITTGADIPLPAVLLNDADFLAAILAYSSGYQTYDATELIRWNDGAIYTQTLQEINMADV